MILKPINARMALNRSFLKVKPIRAEIDLFKTNLRSLLNSINDIESEEFHKNLVSDFLKDTYYKQNHYINTKGRNDLVIHNGQNATSTVGVIIEVKKPTNNAEMMSTKKLNSKAFHELVLYYLRERITLKNLEIKHVVATNLTEWFIFDATLFDRLFAQNKNLIHQFTDFESGRLADIKTDFFYKQIAEPFIDNISAEIEFTYFNIQDFQKPLLNNDQVNDNSLIALFKLLAPEHLLKLPFINDSNTLNKGFYSELLHIIGLTETKEGSKKLIKRNKEGERISGTILEDAIIQLDSLDKLSRLDKSAQYGNTPQNQLFGVALELSITWINRILFLKLLEAQLIKYHKGDKSYSFLNSNKVKNYNDLNSLFFQVLARQHSERNEDVQKIFEKVPYLNSSLFEPTNIEQVTLFISNLKDDKTIPIISSTVLKDNHGKRRTGNLNTLEYLFEFLNAYDFSSEGSEEIQEDNKTLINAAVLGLIFEKINGYKDGSFFTPGFITMYMCRETIRNAVLQKFDEYCLNHNFRDYKIDKIEDIYELIPQKISLEQANKIVNSLKVCDPAVGSGHFLVSALNEIIAVKNDLGILCDFEGRPLKNYWVQVINDELFITEKETDKEFYYVAPSPRTEKSLKHTFGGTNFKYTASKLPERQVVQQSIFHEKQTIIENCLFGVDINPNSVKICRLRLWIELLKNAYYTAESNFTALETLPNIDINIKCGNSLVSRFAIDADLKKALKKSKWTIDSYRLAVQTYRNALNKEEKREMENLILKIKQSFSTEIRMNDPLKKRLDKLASELYYKFTGAFLFEQQPPFNKTEQELEKKRQEERIKLEAEMESLNLKIEEIKSNKIFENAFEWRFEFPEVLNDEGDFIGFDVVIGNPPYMILLEKSTFDNYKFTIGNNNTYSAFIELSLQLCKRQHPNSIMIIPNTWLSGNNYLKMREYLLDNKIIDKIIQLPYDIFDVYVDTIILHLSKVKNDLTNIYKFQIREKFDSNIQYDQIKMNEWNKDDNKTIFVNKNILNLRMKYIKNAVKLNEIANIQRGTLPPKDNELKEIDEIKELKLEKYIPWFDGQIYRYEKKAQSLKYVEYNKLKENKDYTLFNTKKILARQLISRQFQLQMTIIDECFAFKKNLYAIFNLNENYINYEALLALLNSSFYSYIIINSNTSGQRDDFPALSLKDFKEFLIPKLTSQNKIQLTLLVNKILKQKQKKSAANTNDLENQINQLVYQIYELTDKEIKLIETS
ncbi:MAG: Eco57I restriction-modification methylase domain-containing protein [Sediminibacterium sp.]|nr:Eco57I restriction-modification methylase domain-containing protein [Sediminibacterium sp.]